MVRFSIITVTYNAGDKLRETVTDTLRQTYDNYEIIVKDGLSADDSLCGLPTSDKIKVESRKDSGIYDAMNQAVAMSNGDYIIFMNCGDFFYDEFVLQKLADCIEKKPHKGIYYGDVHSRISDAVIHAASEITDFVCFRHIPCHQACVFSRKLFAKQGFCVEYKIRADYEFFLRQYYQEEIRPFYTGIVIADYEGGGYSETKENMARDKREHKIITSRYIKKSRLYIYRFIMFMTLQPLRKKIAQNKHLAKAYNKTTTEFVKKQRQE